jgi:hypothetical protein
VLVFQQSGAINGTHAVKRQRVDPLLDGWRLPLIDLSQPFWLPALGKTSLWIWMMA